MQTVMTSGDDTDLARMLRRERKRRARVTGCILAATGALVAWQIISDLLWGAW